MSNVKARAEAGTAEKPTLVALIEKSGNTLTEAEARAAGFTDEDIEPVKVRLRKVEQLSPNRMQDAEFGRLEKVAVAHENTMPQDLLRQDYWAHVATQLQPWARLEIRANDATWLWEGVVLEAGRNWANVRQLNLYMLSTEDIAKTNAAIQSEYLASPYEVRYRGEFELWSVIRKVDSAVVHEKEATKAGADLWLRERLKADKVT